MGSMILKKWGGEKGVARTKLILIADSLCLEYKSIKNPPESARDDIFILLNAFILYIKIKPMLQDSKGSV